MRRFVLIMLICLFIPTSLCLAKPPGPVIQSATAMVQLTLDPYCYVNIKKDVNVTVPSPGPVPKNKVGVEVGSNFNYDVKVEWQLPSNWPKGVTTHDNLTRKNLPPGIHKGDIWLGGMTTLEDLATVYKGVVVITISCTP